MTEKVNGIPLSLWSINIGTFSMCLLGGVWYNTGIFLLLCQTVINFYLASIVDSGDSDVTELKGQIFNSNSSVLKYLFYLASFVLFPVLVLVNLYSLAILHLINFYCIKYLTEN